MNKTVTGSDGKPRCNWCSAAPEFFHYHDTEWGFPVGEDMRLFEKICLESFQSGLSWRTILAKRDNFREAFHHFDFKRISKFKEEDCAFCKKSAKVTPALKTPDEVVMLQRK